MHVFEQRKGTAMLRLEAPDAFPEFAVRAGERLEALETRLVFLPPFFAFHRQTHPRFEQSRKVYACAISNQTAHNVH
jgi:hypothetical protein